MKHLFFILTFICPNWVSSYLCAQNFDTRLGYQRQIGKDYEGNAYSLSLHKHSLNATLRYYRIQENMIALGSQVYADYWAGTSNCFAFSSGYWHSLTKRKNIRIGAEVGLVAKRFNESPYLVDSIVNLFPGSTFPDVTYFNRSSRPQRTVVSPQLRLGCEFKITNWLFVLVNGVWDQGFSTLLSGRWQKVDPTSQITEIGYMKSKGTHKYISIGIQLKLPTTHL